MILLGIAGGTASGKTTIALALVERLGTRARRLAHDRYYHSLPEGQDPRGVNFDHPDALDTVRLVADLHALRRGQSAQLPRYDWATHRRRDDTEEIASAPLVVVDGILALCDPTLRSCFDHRVYVDAPDDVRLIRRLRRDVAERGRQVADILEQWERSVAPMHRKYVAPSRAHAELVLDGTATTASQVDALLALLRKELA